MSHDEPSQSENRPAKQPLADRLIIDAGLCAGCRDCEMVCSLLHEGRIVPALARLRVGHDLFNDDHPAVAVCRQCRRPACLAACPRSAIVVDERTGARVVDTAACDGCGLCVEACPYDMIWLHPGSGKAYTCDLCGGRPRCVEACPQDAIACEDRSTLRLRTDREARRSPIASSLDAQEGQRSASRGRRPSATGLAGRLLRIDLTSGQITQQPTADYGDLGGGVGIAARIYLDEVARHIGPLDPDNLLLFMSGRLTGTPAPGSGRAVFYSASPVGHPHAACRPSSIGGYLGAELKYAGFDGLIVSGAAERPVYLWVHDGSAELCDASDLWGLNTFATQQALLERHDRRAAAASIGPSGERLGRMASIVHGTGFASGLSGFGAVMGSKRLKGIVVRGRGGIAVADPDALLAAVARITPAIYDPADPPRMTGMRGTGWQYPGGWEFLKHHSVGILACHGCPVACQGVFRVPGVPLGADCCVWPHAMLLGYTQGEEGWKAIWEIDSLVNRLGLSLYEVGQCFQFVLQLRDGGLIDDAGSGLTLHDDPRDLLKQIVYQIAYQEGLGELLAQGLPRAAQAIGGAAEQYVVGARGWPILLPSEDPRCDATSALLSTVGAYAPFNDTWGVWRSFKGAFHLPVDDPREELGDEEIERVNERLYGDPHATDSGTFNGKAAIAARAQEYRMLNDALGLCTWVWPLDVGFYDAEHAGDQTALAEVAEAAMGPSGADEQLKDLAVRLCDLERLQGIARGYHSLEADMEALGRRTFSERHPDSPLPGGRIDRDRLAREVQRYYELRGWDPLSGVPGPEKAARLGLHSPLTLHRISGSQRETPRPKGG